MINVLLVEDTKMGRDCITGYLRGSDRYRLAASITNAAMAETTCLHMPIDLILMDYCTENDEDGIAAAAVIKRRMPHIKIIIITSMASIDLIDRAREAGADSFWYFGTFTFHSDPNGTHWTKQMYVQYTELAGPKAPYPLLMWHGGLTGVTWETAPDGREGWDTLFLRMGFDVYVSDAVERGRASWAKFPDVNPTPPIFHSYESRWLNLKMGAVYPEPYEGQRFPVQYYDQLMMQGVPRWMTSDEWTQAAYDQYLERLETTLPGVILMPIPRAAPLP